MALTRTNTQKLFDRAKKVMPYGVNSNFRYWGDDKTHVFVRGEKCYVFDADENRYIDYRLGFGPVILGHGYPAVVERMTRALKDGGVYAATHPLEIIVAERIARMTGMDKVRLVNSGTEATMHALRIARAHTNREKFIKFEGAYHGMHDNVLFSTSMSLSRTFGSRRSPVQVASGSGIPRALNEYVITLPFNDPEMLHKTLQAKWGDIAAILIEPIMGNAASLMPEPGFLQTIRRLCDEYGIVMIMDEVKTGFRIANGGAQEYFGVKADLATYAKAMANGYPLAAIAGMDEVMSVIEPGKISLGGTYCGNIPGTAATDATLEILEKQDILGSIGLRGERLKKGIDQILDEADLPHVVMGPPQMFGFFIGSHKVPRDYRDLVAGADIEFYEKFAFEMIDRGVMPEPDNREPWFLCYEHTDAVVDETLNIFQDALTATLSKHSPHLIQ
ncbi:MAG TPA: guanitoxin biosynthesis PLP-dependent transaminase GntE [Anaerolineae bacterium]|nr:guanitoxin biosynthesis PLP-dependent transaminase GntE [Anaerolineae bacterium]